ncbi:MAG: HIT family protein, partial [Candidatus Heimdallarchaeota archaeon]
NHEQIGCLLVINRTKDIIQNSFNPSGFNVGINVGTDAGQTIFHSHIHLIPRFKGDVQNPRGGVRKIINGKGDY